MFQQNHPILFSFRRCPYAMRARLALAASQIQCELREVVLKDKPEALLTLSDKATVPVLQTVNGDIIDESLDIMFWALNHNDPYNWYQTLDKGKKEQADNLIRHNDDEFKYYLDRYKYADRYPEHTEQYYRQQGEKTLTRLEKLLNQHGCLLQSDWTIADIALLPFIRQFAFVDKAWFEQSPYPAVRHWLDKFLQSDLFKSIMRKYPQWHAGDDIALFP
ncbi:glutathione S-transferase [Methylophaga sp.]|uniref:glutathione S-transferase n=1 Tax=Methylophaga sp. TaxID=2024840 RepID=UPI003F699F6D